MSRLPTPGTDSGTWGDILNDFLDQSHNSDGTLKSNTVGSAQIKNASVGATEIATGSITESLLNSAVQTKLNSIAPVLTVNSQTGNVILSKSDIGLGNVDNTSDAAKNAAAVALTNKTLSSTNTVTLLDTNFTIQDNIDATKQVKLQASGITTGTTRTLTIPDANTTIVGTDAVQTLTNKTISGASNTLSNIPEAAVTNLTTDLSGKEPTITAGTTSQYWRGDKSWQTLDKTAVGLANVDNTSDATKNSAAVTLTNKTISLASNTVTGIPSDFVLVSVGDAAARTVGGGDMGTIGMYVGRAFTLTKVVYQFATADASGNTSVEIRRNGSQVASSNVTVSAANQADGTGTDAARTATPSQSFSIGDRVMLYITAVGTTPGNGMRAYLFGTWN